MAGGRPFVIRWGWTSGGGHFLTARGFVGSNTNGNVYLYDPWSGERIMSYLGTVSSPAHNWSHTLRLTGVTMPSADINVNGNEGPNFFAPSTTSLNVNISLNPNGHTNAADFWVVYEIGGTTFYLDRWGNLTTIPTPWRQGPLTTINQSVYSGTLPIGTYNMYFGVDLTQNGVLDGDLYWDTIRLTVF
jgi:hypothetical protein